MSYSSLWRRMKTWFNAAGYPNAVPYVVRKTATVWAARCGGALWAILATGRWKQHSKHFLAYIHAGVLEGEESEAQAGKDDPIRQILVYKPTVFGDKLPAELL